MSDKNTFFRFYVDGFEETKKSYETIIHALVDAGILEKGTTLETVVQECIKIDADEEKTAADEGRQIREFNIGLRGYFAAKGFLEKDFKEIGQKGLETLNKKLKEIDEKEDTLKEEKDAIIDASAFLGSLAAGTYFPRQTCFSASLLMGLGRIMQIGCSQGKTSVVAMTTYEQLMKGKKIFSTSSAPGLVPKNYDEARTFYEKMGIAEDFCAISQNASDNIEHIVLFHKNKKYEVRADGVIYEEVVKEENGKKQKRMEPIENIDKSFLEDLGIEVSNSQDVSYNFEATVKSMMDKKGIIMGDTITLSKYQHLMPVRNEEGVIENSFLIVDEADAELYDTQPQEIIEKEFSPEIAKKKMGK